MAKREPISLPSVADVATMPAELLPALLAGLAAVQAAVAARLAAPGHGAALAFPGPEPGRSADRLLTVEQLAERLGRDPRYVYRRAHSWDFTVKDGKRLCFSERGFTAWMERLRVRR